MLIFGVSSAMADDLDFSIKRGEYELFYSAFNTSFISPDVAQAAGIVRGKNKGLVNISVVRYENSERIPVVVQAIRGEAYDLIYRNALQFKPVSEPGAQYYLAPFKISSDNEYIQFDIQVDLKALQESVPITFKRRFYID